MLVAEDPASLLDDDEDSPFALRHPLEIASVLRTLVEARSIITAYLVPGGLACPTALLAVHDDGTLILDGNRHEAMNRRMADASRLVCKTQLDLVPIRFRLPAPTPMDYQGYAAFLAPWPDLLLRLQRRELYRLQVAPTAPVTLYIGDGDTAPEVGKGGLRVLDISGGGLAVAVPDDEARRFSVHSRIAPCLLRLGDMAPMQVMLEVSHIERFDLRGALFWRAGCRFVDLSAAFEQRVLQYIFQIERLRNARQRHGG